MPRPTYTEIGRASEEVQLSGQGHGDSVMEERRMKPSDMVKERYCRICSEANTSWCENCCVVADIIGDLEEMEEEDR